MRHRGTVLVVATAILAACSLGPQGEPTSVDIDVGEPTFPLGPPPSGVGEDDEDDDPPDEAAVAFTATIYLVSADSRLVPVAREVTSTRGAGDRLVAMFEALVGGPTDDELDRGLRSLVPPTTEVLDARLVDGLVTVDLSSSFASIGGPSELLAIGQLVLTGTTYPGARELALELDDTPTAIPLPDGALSTEPVTLRDFTALLDPVERPAGEPTDEPADEPAVEPAEEGAG